MKQSTGRILTTHAGRLDGPPDLMQTSRDVMAGRAIDAKELQPRLRNGIADVIRKQVEAGIDVISDGELTKFGFGSLAYYGRRLNGLGKRPLKPVEAPYMALEIKHEYKAIVEAGLILQIDDPALPDTYDMIVPLPSIEEYRKFAAMRVDALNHALQGLPEHRVRYHICWGSWHGPHTHDLPLKHVIDLMLKVKAGAYSVEAGNARHEHEWKLWKQYKLPQGKILIPGVVSHASNVVEHPELVADRIVLYAGLVGRENVIAGTDCGMGMRVHPQIAWAKLKALSEGAALATKELWSR